MPLFIAITTLVALSTAILLHQYRHRAFDASEDAAADAAASNDTTPRAA